jgi:hypothetical protein
MPAQTGTALFRPSYHEACAVTRPTEAGVSSDALGSCSDTQRTSLGASTPGNDLLVWRVCVLLISTVCSGYSSVRTKWIIIRYNFGRPMRWCEDNIKKDTTELQCRNLGYIHVVLIGTSDWLLWTLWWIFGCQKMMRIYWVAMRLLAFQEGSFSTKWLR